MLHSHNLWQNLVQSTHTLLLSCVPENQHFCLYLIWTRAQALSLRMSSQREGRGRTWECCKEVSHRLWTETCYGDGYRSGCPDNGGEMGSLSIVDELHLFRGDLTFRHIFTRRDLNWWHTQTRRRRYAMSINSTVSRG